MIVSRRWLEALLGKPLEGQDVADRLARQVAPVDGVVPIHQDLRDVVVARVLEVRQHPNADRLTLCMVDAGGTAPVEVVCGAQNVQAGKTYPFAPVGATLPGGLKLERRKIRGVESNGMLCSAKELGLGVDHAGILELQTEAPPGTPFLEAVPIADEQIIIDVSANRPDLLCHKGVARELAVGLGATVKLPPIGMRDAGSEMRKNASHISHHASRGTVDGVDVRLEDPEGAPRYMIAVIRGVKVQQSPAWLAARLQSVGQRSINNIVDATNYILFEVNQPLHAFDLAKLRGPAVVVRRAKPNEPIVTLDGVQRKLNPEMTVICDAERPTIVAGVMGSAESEVTESTTDIVLEAAYFQPTRIRRTRRALGLSSRATASSAASTCWRCPTHWGARSISSARSPVARCASHPSIFGRSRRSRARSSCAKRASVSCSVWPCRGKKSSGCSRRSASSPRPRKTVWRCRFPAGVPTSRVKST